MADFRVTDAYGRHESGTKFYQVITITNSATNDAVMISRWGKLEALGQLDIEVGKVTAINAMADRKVRQKSGRGYGFAGLGRNMVMAVNDSDGAENFLARNGFMAKSQWQRVVEVYKGRLETIGFFGSDHTADPIAAIIESVAPEVEGPGHEEWGTW